MAVIAVPVQYSTPTPNLLRGKRTDALVHASNTLHCLCHSLLIDFHAADTVCSLRCANERHAELVRDAMEREAKTFGTLPIIRKGPFTTVIGKCEFRFVSPIRSYHAKLLHRDVPASAGKAT
jgi:hypothetical protein